MSNNFDRNKKTIKEVTDAFSAGTLIVDNSYQRRRVWLPQDNVRLIETILLELVVPEVFFWKAEADADTGESITHIVDGQQRINAIMDFISDEYELKSNYLLDENTKTTCGNKHFSELAPKDKSTFWDYSLSIVNIDKDFSKDDIKNMFYRLNLTNYNLNPEERRNSIDSKFGDAAESLTGEDFWQETRLFSANDARRMKDVGYCCSIYILAFDGIIDQTRTTVINDYYDDYATEFDEDKQLFNKVIQAMDIIKSLNDKQTIQFISKKAQMYTLFSVAFRIIDNEIEYKEEFFDKFKAFVNAYTKFKNEYNIDFEVEADRNMNEDIKKYKLASSEGINKRPNRVIRYEILYKIIVDSSIEVIDTFKNLEVLYKNQEDESKYQEFDDEDKIDIKMD